jgi:MbtH protein
MSSRYKVVINHEEQYSILPIAQPVTRGWQEVGGHGSGDECLRHIEEVWTDMRPAQREELQTVIRRG